MAEVVRCRYVTGVLQEIEIEDLNEFVTPGSVLEQRLVRVNGRVYVRKFVSRTAGSANQRLYDLLYNEVRAGARLAQVFPGRYPAELAHLVAYNLDAEEPFVLLREYIGTPASSKVHRFDDTQRRRFEHGLLRAVYLTSVADVVHGAVSMDAVRCHDGQVQLVDFEFAERVGESRRCGGIVDQRDDLWGAGQVIRRLHLGETSSDRSQDPQRLRTLLDPVFDNPVEQQPTAAQLLAVVRADNHLPIVANPDAAFEQGRRLFDQVCLRKRGPVTGNAAPPPEQGKPAKRSFFRFMTRMVLLINAVVAGVVVMFR
ncbi:hypothetical protein Lesp02_01980 [Lentzea sp. NBRC 105346]|uniref:hypothetical protein n=1 Tax=Lentzea sp. NBRC 105346 TaxID=3032205 RepID=UPI0024A4E378|nr:hypothetical protein [Lentzea sp. NBRC 105346]GLZ28008.1 hypothetical protein Lesp02_01980 [Lentzea sp. NBRC 105346]